MSAHKCRASLLHKEHKEPAAQGQLKTPPTRRKQRNRVARTFATRLTSFQQRRPGCSLSYFGALWWGSGRTAPGRLVRRNHRHTLFTREACLTLRAPTRSSLVTRTAEGELRARTHTCVCVCVCVCECVEFNNKQVLLLFLLNSPFTLRALLVG